MSTRRLIGDERSGNVQPPGRESTSRLSARVSEHGHRNREVILVWTRCLCGVRGAVDLLRSGTMVATKTLFRPVGQAELDIIRATGMRRFRS